MNVEDHDLELSKVPPRVLKQILEDAVLLEQVSDRVYELLRQDLKQQRERKQGYGRRF
jgi:hypothetical protein